MRFRTLTALTFLLSISCDSAAPASEEMPLDTPGPESESPASDPEGSDEEVIGEAQAGADGGAAQAESGIPCDVAEVLSKHCAKCHGAEPVTPLSLVTRAQFAARSARDNTQTVAQRVKLRIHDAENTMPPRSSQDKLSEAELATLDAWLDQGAPRRAQGCRVTAPEAPTVEIDRSEAELVTELRANNVKRGNAAAPFALPANKEQYECFTFDIPWKDVAHGLAFEAIIDNPAVVHHWSLSSIEADVPVGSRTGMCGYAKGRLSLAAWAPGDEPTVLPKDVGVRMAGGATGRFQLEMHYNNLGNPKVARDRSGVRIYATNKLKPHEAGPTVFGTLCLGPNCQGIPPGRSTVTNTCMNRSPNGPAHLLWSSPHMHKLGKHLKTVINRADGTKEVLIDVDFDFNDQRDYPTDKVINPGDSLTTTCTYENTTNKNVKWGEGSGDEMCWNFLMAYPPRSLSSFGGFCMGANQASPAEPLDPAKADPQPIPQPLWFNE